MMRIEIISFKMAGKLDRNMALCLKIPTRRQSAAA